MSKDKKNKISDEIQKELDSWNKEGIRPLPEEEKKGILRVFKEASFYDDLSQIEEDIKDVPLPEKITYLEEVIRQNGKIKGNNQIENVTKQLQAKLENLEIRYARFQKNKEENKGTPPTLKKIEDNKLKHIFNFSKFNGFRKLEQRLFDRTYIDKNRQWQSTAPELVILILALRDANNHYFKNNVTDRQIKDFFQKLYQKNITQQWEPARRKNITQSEKQVFQNMIDD